MRPSTACSVASALRALQHLEAPSSVDEVVGGFLSGQFGGRALQQRLCHHGRAEQRRALQQRLRHQIKEASGQLQEGAAEAGEAQTAV